VQTVDAIKALLPTIKGQLPAAMTLDVRSDRAMTIRESIHDVNVTLIVTICLVILAIFIFLRNVSATLIPSLALPGSILGTFTVMYLLGYSLDNLSLMAITLAVGFVVDDAIVMLENIVRHMEMGKPPMQAAYDGSKEIAFTILSMTVSLVAVFIPVLFMGGIVGRLLREFAVTITAAILVSGFMSISLTPMLCSRFLRPPHDQRHGWVYNLFERMFDAWRRAYDITLSGVLRFRPVVMAVSFVLLAVTVYLFIAVPKGFLPNEDQGRFNVNTEGAQGIAFKDMVDHQLKVADVLMKDPNIASVGVNVGQMGNNATGGSNTGRMFVELKPRRERDVSVDQVIASLRPKLAELTGIRSLHAESAADQSRWRRAEPRPLSIHHAGHRHRRAVQVGAGARSSDPADARLRGRE
jgi:HAE1 family hydrophobic/amphiphilic exporter-1